MPDTTSHLFWYPGHELLLHDIVRAENCHLHDSAGNMYVDLESGVWCSSLGHGNQRLLRTISEQGSRIAHVGFNYSSRIVEEAAREILTLLGHPDGRCVFLCSGSEAVEYGVRIAQRVAAGHLLMTMADSYFGAYGSASARRDDEWYCVDWSGCAECPDSRECDRHCVHWAAIPFEHIGGFLFEPGSSSGLVRFPPAKLIQRIVRVIKANQGLILVNEVTTGIGRTGLWFGHQHYGIVPDIVAVGKGIGNGYPVSATVVAPTVVSALNGEPIKYAQSHQNDPLGAAVAREVICIIQEDDLIAKGREIGDLLQRGLEAIMARTARIRQVRGRGLMVAVELRDDPEASGTLRVHRKLVRRGFVTGRRPGTSVLRLDPSLTIERRDIEAFLATLEDVLADW